MHWLDPDHLPETTGTLGRFLLNPHGETDGMILSDGTEVHFPPHMAAEIRAAVRPGEIVKVRGARPRAADMIAAVAVESMTGERIVDHGPPNHGKKKDKKEAHDPATKIERRKMSAAGVVERPLHGPKGEVRGALLQDGTIVRFPPRDAAAIGGLLSPGAYLVALGEGLVTELGTVIDALEIGATKDSIRPIKPKKPKPKKPPKDGKGAHAA
jgi:hypothetical protein